jgi:tripartite-type tricarboxylate transporter receptor subunit TctC
MGATLRRVPARVIGQLHAEARAALLNPDVVRRMHSEGTEVVGNPPREFATEVKQKYDKWRTLVQRTGLKL